MNTKKLFLSIISVLLALMISISFVGCKGSEETTTTTTTEAPVTSVPDEGGEGNAADTEGLDINPETFYLIDALFQNLSIRDYDPQEALLAAVRAYLTVTGDKYATYYTPDEMIDQATENNGDLYGIGVTVIFDYEGYFMEVVAIVPDSPASKLLKVGDKVTHFYEGGEYVSISDRAKEYEEKYKLLYTDPEDEELVISNAAYDAYQDAVDNVKGEEGTYAKFKIDRNGTSLDMSVQRAKVKSISVSYSVSKTNKKVGIVSINAFNMTTPVQFREAMDALINKGVNKFVFDVRNNPGGDLASIVAVLSTLLNQDDVILSTKDTNGTITYTKVTPLEYGEPGEGEADYRTCNVTPEDIGKYRGYDMVVLTNANTASAAELFTAALRDYELAEIVGTKTYGKGSMQSTIRLSYYGDSYIGGLKLTTKLYFPPCGEGYDGGIGIEPDYPVELEGEAATLNFYKLTEDNDNQLQKAIYVVTH